MIVIKLLTNGFIAERTNNNSNNKNTTTQHNTKTNN